MFEGGFLGLDNIGPIDRSAALPGDVLEQSDGTAWMAMFCLNLLEMSLVLAAHEPAYEDMCTKFFEHFTYIASAMYDQGLWNEEDGFYYDVLHRHDSGEHIPMRVRSMVGLIPLCATTTLGRTRWPACRSSPRGSSGSCGTGTKYAKVVAARRPRERPRRPAAVDRVARAAREVLEEMLDENEFLSPYGIRSVSRYHLEHPFELDLDGTIARVDYDPGESTSGVFGGNSNWRGPVWFPVNYLLIESLRRFHRYLGTTSRWSIRPGPGRHCTLGEVADDLAQRLVNLFMRTPSGRRPVFGACRSSRPTRRGTTRCCSTSTSTATRARASAPCTRPAGRRSSPT